MKLPKKKKRLKKAGAKRRARIRQPLIDRLIEQFEHGELDAWGLDKQIRQIRVS